MAVSSDQAPDALGPYSQAIVAGGLVFCSGMAGIDPATGAIADGIEAQTEQALLNLDRLAWRHCERDCPSSPDRL
jgi:2-iminobutanoate/2-iminopropanoate deaminase